MSQSKKQNFLQGAALLAIATAVVKVIGALYKIPLKMVIGDQGFGYFSTAYQIYSVLLMISTAGFPIAMSRIISQASSLGNYNQVRKVYKTARAIFLGIGTVSTLLMMLFCRQLAAFQEQPDACHLRQPNAGGSGKTAGGFGGSMAHHALYQQCGSGSSRRYFGCYRKLPGLCCLHAGQVCSCLQRASSYHR